MAKPITHYLFILLFLGLCSSHLLAHLAPPSDTLQAHNLEQELNHLKPIDAFVVKDLIPGYHYSFLFRVTDPNACLPDLQVDFPHERLRENAWQVIISFRATHSFETFRIQKNCADLLPNNYFVASNCVDCIAEETHARNLPKINTRGNVDPEVLVKDVFIGGGCFDVDNISFSGPGQARGTFSSGMASIDMEEGVILSTGNVRNAIGPNNDTGAGNTFGFGYDGGDPDLRKLLPAGSAGVYDVAILEFDFTPTTDQVSFEYVFASEEYCEYVGEKFNDVFGFFISGPGINGPFTNGAKNIATIPGSAAYVSINSVNFSENDNYYHDNVNGLNALFGGCKFGEVVNGSKAKNEIQFDGFTTVLTASSSVIPCETYHIKLAVGDVGDGVFDSAVFLKANSFDLGDPAELGVAIPEAVFPDSSLVYESCQESYFVFKRTEDSNINRPQTVPFTVSELSTATPYEDFSPIPSPVIIPAGQDSVLVPVLIYNDDIVEEPETIIFELETACTCEGILTELIIVEPEPFSINFDDVSTCPGGTVNLSPNIEGGISAYSFNWNNGASDSLITETIETPTNYAVTVTDNCGLSAEASVLVILEEQKAVLSGEVLVCNGEKEGQIEVNFTGTAPFSLEYTFDGADQMISNIESNTFILPVDEEGVYEAVRMFSGGCEGAGEGSAAFIITDVDFDLNISPPQCHDSSDGFVKVELEPGDYSFSWNNGANTQNLSNLEAGEYSVFVTNEFGCTHTKTTRLIGPDPITPNIQAQGISNCYNPNGGSILLEVTGGSPGYLFSWNNGVGNVQNPTNLLGGTYKVNIQDAFGCTTTASVDIPTDMEEPLVEARTDELITCRKEVVQFNTTGTSEGANFSYQWTTTEGNILSNATSMNPFIDRGGVYEFTVTNELNGCTKRKFVNVPEDRKRPEITIEQPGELNCLDHQQQLTADVFTETNNFTIAWTSNNGSFASDQDVLNPIVDAPGDYYFEVLNEDNGCSRLEKITVVQNVKKPDAEILTPLPLTCTRNATSLKTQIAMTDGDYEFSWQTQNGHFLENRNTLNPSVDQPGEYVLMVKDVHNFCENVFQTNVLIDTVAPEIEAGEGFVFTCALTSAQLSGSTLQTGDYVFEWITEEGNILGGGNTLSPMVNAAGSYMLVVTDQSNGCIAKDFVTIQDDSNRPQAIIADPDPITCTNALVTLDAAGSSTGSTLEYRWETLDGNIVNADNPMNPQIDAPGIYQLFILNPANECEGKRQVEVLLDTISPIAILDAPEILNCTKNEVRIEAGESDTGPDFIFNWSTTDGNIISKPDVISPLVSAAGTYTVEISNTQNGCVTLASLQIIEEKPHGIDLEVAQPACFGDRGQAAVLAVKGGVGPYQYSIDGGNSFYNDPRFGQLAPGYYNLKVQDINGCSIEEVIRIEEPQALLIDLNPQVELKLGDSIELEAIPNIPMDQVADISWSPAHALSCDDCINPTARPFRSQQYEVEIVDQNGCAASASLQLLVDETPYIFVPNVFRPYSSELGNDRITIFAREGMIQQILTFEIYNRWGETVYHRNNFMPNDPSLGWDGRLGREKMRPAVFVYRADVEMIDGRKIQIKGDFSLLE